MKTVRTKAGPFKERPYFELHDIELMCLHELQASNLYPTTPSPIRIDRFIEKRFKISHQYDDLPDGLLGFTKFGPDGVEAIIVSRALSDEGSQAAERRINTTLAHESGHGLMHAHLFALGKKPKGLFGDDADETPEILCRNIPGTPARGKSSYDGRWWEFQANRAIGALLLPRPLVDEALKPYLIPKGMLGAYDLDRRHEDQAIATVSESFDVNPAVAKIRLDEMYPETPQLRL